MEGLDFQGFSAADGSQGYVSMQSISQQQMTGNLLDADPSRQQKLEDGTSTANKAHFLSLTFYQQFFEIDEDQVFARILNSMFPRRLGNFIADFVQPNPDLWGPFWLSTTLIFSIAIVGNLARFLQTYGSAADEYTSDFSFVTGATSLVFGYVLLLPAAIYSFLWYHRPTTGLQYSFFDLLCAYGYSMAIFIPVSIICPLLPLNGARWALTLSSALLSGSVLVIALWATVRDDPNRLSSLGFVAAIFAAHLLLAVCLKEFFFDAAAATASSAPALPPLVVPTLSPPPPSVLSPTAATNSSG